MFWQSCIVLLPVYVSDDYHLPSGLTPPFFHKHRITERPLNWFVCPHNNMEGKYSVALVRRTSLRPYVRLGLCFAFRYISQKLYKWCNNDEGINPRLVRQIPGAIYVVFRTQGVAYRTSKDSKRWSIRTCKLNFNWYKMKVGQWIDLG